jgi:hypothetical protein
LTNLSGTETVTKFLVLADGTIVSALSGIDAANLLLVFIDFSTFKKTSPVAFRQLLPISSTKFKQPKNVRYFGLFRFATQFKNALSNGTSKFSLCLSLNQRLCSTNGPASLFNVGINLNFHADSIGLKFGELLDRSARRRTGFPLYRLIHGLSTFQE